MFRALFVTALTVFGCAAIGAVEGGLLGYLCFSDPLERMFLVPIGFVFGLLVGALFGTLLAPRVTRLLFPRKDDDWT
jgi:hypothetical protein